MKLSELAKQITDRIAENGDVEVFVSPYICDFEGRDFEVMVIDEEPPEYRAYQPEEPYLLYFNKTKKGNDHDRKERKLHAAGRD